MYHIQRSLRKCAVAEAVFFSQQHNACIVVGWISAQRLNGSTESLEQNSMIREHSHAKWQILVHAKFIPHRGG